MCFSCICLCLPCLLALCLSLIPIRDGRFASQLRIVAGLLSAFLLGLGGFLCLLGGSDVRIGLGDGIRSRGFGGFHRSCSLCGLLLSFSHLRFRALGHSHHDRALLAHWRAGAPPPPPLPARLSHPLRLAILARGGLEVVGEPTLVERSADVEVCRRGNTRARGLQPARGQHHAAVDLETLLVVIVGARRRCRRRDEGQSRGILGSLVRAPVVRHDVIVGEDQTTLRSRDQGRPGGCGCR